MGKAASQFLHKGRVDIHEALEASEGLMELWRESQKHPGAPPFSGGVLDAWPAYAVDALALARDEMQLIRGFLSQGKAG